MDTTFTLHILSKLDLLREEQIRISERMNRNLQQMEEVLQLLRGTKTSRPPETEPFNLKKWLGLLKPLLAIVVQSAAGVLAVAYALKGGDIVTAITTLLKLL